ncbi:hypothetical protein DERF_002943 [Dermatophagoides farinae]|uniref:Uncharacterized protein n=1 Tax=Dermatophagoides farinae TaxID=6954 RepID=A0A922IF90_DERFA|nr:hypothetical protein DERF_002943 [Dermatophagoides farinae]
MIICSHRFQFLHFTFLKEQQQQKTLTKVVIIPQIPNKLAKRKKRFIGNPQEKENSIYSFDMNIHMNIK